MKIQHHNESLTAGLPEQMTVLMHYLATLSFEARLWVSLAMWFLNVRFFFLLRSGQIMPISGRCCGAS